jgi:hypothetical protein
MKDSAQGLATNQDSSAELERGGLCSTHLTEAFKSIASKMESDHGWNQILGIEARLEPDHGWYQNEEQLTLKTTWKQDVFEVRSEWQTK